MGIYVTPSLNGAWWVVYQFMLACREMLLGGAFGTLRSPSVDPTETQWLVIKKIYI